MNFQMSKVNAKGNEEIRLSFSPSDNLEREFFNALFVQEGAVIEAVPNSDEIVIKKNIKSPEKIN